MSDDRPASQITVVVDDVPPIYLAYQDGESPWQELDFTSGQPLKFTAHGYYRLMAVCDRRNFFETGISGRTTADGGTISPSCASIAAASASRNFVNASGSMSAPGRILFAGKAVDGTTNNWNFNLAVTKGEHDLIAISDDNKVVVQNQVDLVELDNTIPVIDAASGVAMRALDFTIAGGVGDPSVSVSFVSKVDGLGTLDEEDGTSAFALPDSVAGDEFTQTVQVTVQSGDSEQTAIQPVGATVTTNLQMLPSLTDAEFSDGSVAWTGALPEGLVRADATDPSNGNVIHFDATSSFLAGSTRLSLRLESADTITDFSDDFVADTVADTTSLSVERTSGDVTFRTTRLPASSSKVQRSR